jgi:hypothetical protein
LAVEVDGRCSGLAGGGHAEVGGSVDAAVDLDGFVFGAGEADFEAFGFAVPALAFRLRRCGR